MLMSVCAIIGMGNSAHIFLLQHLKRKQRIKWMMGVKKKKNRCDLLSVGREYVWTFPGFDTDPFVQSSL